MVDRQVVIAPPGTYVPPGLRGVIRTVSDVEPDDDLEFPGDALNTEYQVIGTSLQNTSGIGVPQTFTVISQTARTNADGSQVIDVVIETDDIQSAVNIDVRMTKL